MLLLLLLSLRSLSTDIFLYVAKNVVLHNVCVCDANVMLILIFFLVCIIPPNWAFLRFSTQKFYIVGAYTYIGTLRLWPIILLLLHVSFDTQRMCSALYLYVIYVRVLPIFSLRKHIAKNTVRFHENMCGLINIRTWIRMHNTLICICICIMYNVYIYILLAISMTVRVFEHLYGCLCLHQ